ncbi:MAG: phosphonate metabolism transcriptional regulator PhnF, partial [Hydrogenophilales bacterium CG15_BIG_FIL_POST_REV_8_21_14_020_62_31]
MSLYAVSRDNGEALYTQIARQLEQEVATAYGPGECLPAEGLLAVRFGVNRHTLRRAIDELVEAGLLERRHGLGVFVLDSQIDYQIGIGTRFTENLAALGLQPENRVLCLQTLAATERVSQRLELNIGDRVFWIETLRTASERQLCVISHFIPADRFADLDTLYK